MSVILDYFKTREVPPAPKGVVAELPEKYLDPQAAMAESLIQVANQRVGSLLTTLGIDSYAIPESVEAWQKMKKPQEMASETFQGWNTEAETKNMNLSINVSEWVNEGSTIPNEEINMVVENKHPQFNHGLESVDLARNMNDQGKEQLVVTAYIKEAGFEGYITLDSATGECTEQILTKSPLSAHQTSTLTAVVDSMHSRVLHFAKKYASKNGKKLAQPMEFARVLIESLAQGIELTQLHDSPFNEISLYSDSGMDATSVHEKFGFSLIKHKLSEVFHLVVPSGHLTDGPNTGLRFDAYASAGVVERMIDDLKLDTVVADLMTSEGWQWKQIVGFPVQPWALRHYNKATKAGTAPRDGNRDQWPRNTVLPDLVSGAEKTINLDTSKLTIGVNALIGALNRSEQCSTVTLDLLDNPLLKSITLFERSKYGKKVIGIVLKPTLASPKAEQQEIYMRLTKVENGKEPEYQRIVDNPYAEAVNEQIKFETINQLLDGLEFENAKERIYNLITDLLKEPTPLPSDLEVPPPHSASVVRLPNP